MKPSTRHTLNSFDQLSLSLKTEIKDEHQLQVIDVID